MHLSAIYYTHTWALAMLGIAALVWAVLFFSALALWRRHRRRMGR